MTIPVPERPTEPVAGNASKKPGAAKVRATASKPPAKPPGGISKPSQRTPKTGAARPGTKAAKILSLLQRPDGASLQELRKATGWQAHSVRGFLAGALKKKLGLRIRSTKRKSGERAYCIVAK